MQIKKREGFIQIYVIWINWVNNANPLLFYISTSWLGYIKNKKMKHIYKIFVLSVTITLAVILISFDFSKTTIEPMVLPAVEITADQGLLYDSVWGSIYHAVESQCDDTPLKTGSGFRINPYKASEQRIIAISHIG